MRGSWLLVVAVPLLACGGPGSSPTASQNAAATETDPAHALLALDQGHYVSRPNTLPCTAAPCRSDAHTAVAHVTFAVTNPQALSRTWHFAGGCAFDVDLLGPDGAVLERLSRQAGCAGPDALTLGPGERGVFTGDLVLQDSAGYQLDGELTARGRLRPAAGEGTPTASVLFSVRIEAP